MRRLAQFVRLRASRVCLASVCVCVHLSRVRLASVSRLSASACICLACVSRLSASVHVKGSECVRRSSCLASVSRLSRVLSRVCICLASVSRLSPCECLRGLAHFMSVVIQRVQKVFAIVILSYNVPMPKYPSHHLIYVFYHPMPIMPLY